MRKISLFIENNKLPIFGLLSLFSSVLIFISAYGSRLRVNPDGISYISLAKQYAEGHFEEALNAWLPPMVSWLMSPLIVFGVDGPLAFFIVNALLGIFIIFFGMYLVWKYSNKNLIATALYWATATPFLVNIAGRTITPDVLVVAWTLGLLAVLVNVGFPYEEYRKHTYVKPALILGLIGATGYFVKPFLLFYFVATIIFWTLLGIIVYWRKVKQWKSKKTILEFFTVPTLTAIVMFAFMAPWVILLSAKYDSFTVTSAFSYHSASLADVDAHVNDGSGEIFSPPPNQYAVSSAEDKTSDSIGTKQKISGAELKYYLGERVEIFPIFVGDLLRMSPWLGVVFSGLLVSMLFGKVNFKKNKPELIAGSLILIHFIGYLAAKARVSTEAIAGLERYNWPVFILGLIIISISLPRFWNTISKQNTVRKGIFVVIIVTLPLMTYMKFIPSFRTFETSQPRPPREIAVDIKNEDLIPEGSKLAGNNRRATKKIAFFLDSQSFGSNSGFDFNSDDVQKELMKYEIEYYFYFTPAEDGPPLDTKAELIYQIFIEKYTCLDLRYGNLGTDIEKEDCNLSVYKL